MAKTVLLVEDDQSLQAAVIARLKASGFTVVTAEDGEEAIAKFTNSHPDLVLLDVILPKKSGLEVLEEIKFKLKSTVPVIVLSNADQDQDVETGKNLGAAEYVTKSNISLRDLIIKINKLLGQPSS